MSWSHVGLAALTAAFVTSLADWFFFGTLFHEHYKAFPEVWRRPQGGAGEGKAVARSAVVSLLTPVVFVGLSAALNAVEPMRVALLAAAIWAIAPLPILVGNFLFLQMHPRILVAHSLGWLVKLLLCAAAVGLWMR